MNARALILGIGSVTLLIGLVILVVAIAVWGEPAIAALGALASISSAAVVWLGIRLR